MSIRKVKNRSGEIKWEVRVYEDGRGSRRLCNRFDKKYDAEVWLIDFENKKAEQIRNPFSAISFENRFFAEEAEYWLMDGRNRFSPGHIVKSEAIVKEINDHFGELKIERLTPEFLSRFQQSELKKGLTPSTVNRKTEVITAILNHSVKHRRIPFNPATGFRKLLKSHREMNFWNQDEAMGFLAHVNEKYPRGSEERWVYVAYLIALNTGLRAGEIWGLRPMDVFEAQRTITVKRQFNRVTQTFGHTKSKKPRAVPANPVLIEEIQDWVRFKKIESTDTIFQNENGKPICHDNFADRRFLRDMKSWGGRLMRFHDLRHTATTLMIANGVDLKTVKEICGHADIATTMNYVHMVSGAVEKVAMSFLIGPGLSGPREEVVVKSSN